MVKNINLSTEFNAVFTFRERDFSARTYKMTKLL